MNGAAPGADAQKAALLQAMEHSPRVVRGWLAMLARFDDDALAVVRSILAFPLGAVVGVARELYLDPDTVIVLGLKPEADDPGRGSDE